MNLMIALMAISGQSAFAQEDVTDILVGGTITNRKTKERLGIACAKKEPVQIGDTKIESCVEYDVYSLNAKNEATYVRNLTPRYEYDAEDIRNRGANRYSNTYYSGHYDYTGFYNNNDPYFYGLAAANIYGCSDSWGWCLLLPLSLVVDTAVTAVTNAALITWDAAMITINLADFGIGNISKGSARRKLTRDLVYMLNGKKKNKNKTVSKNRFERLKGLFQ